MSTSVASERTRRSCVMCQCELSMAGDAAALLKRAAPANTVRSGCVGTT